MSRSLSNRTCYRPCTALVPRTVTESAIRALSRTSRGMFRMVGPTAPGQRPDHNRGLSRLTQLRRFPGGRALVLDVPPAPPTGTGGLPRAGRSAPLGDIG